MVPGESPLNAALQLKDFMQLTVITKLCGLALLSFTVHTSILLGEFDLLVADVPIMNANIGTLVLMSHSIS